MALEPLFPGASYDCTDDQLASAEVFSFNLALLSAIAKLSSNSRNPNGY